ncbi:MAG: ABC transporter ATP-binding protein [Pseudomonadota bacterium]|nr:ABC transporter ATP-binding protein [Pseudomonadota bacterium]
MPTANPPDVMRRPHNGAGSNPVPLLELEKVVTFYGSIQILKGIDIKVFPGEVVSLLGGNASGKTTTMKTILGLVKPVSGTITFAGTRIDGRKSGDIIALGLSPVPEARRLFAAMTVRENLLMGAYARRKADDQDIESTMEEVLEIFPRVKERLNQFGGTLSGGEQQMVAVARALMGRPKLILMDEPSMGLAPALVERVYDVIARIKKQDVAMFIVEQNANMALSVADRGYVLQNGRIVLADTAKRLLKSGNIQKAYLGHA